MSRPSLAPPRLAITMGDPGGIGAEIIAKSLSRPDVRAICRPIIYGHLSTLQAAAAQLDAPLDFVNAATVSQFDGKTENSQLIPVITPPEILGLTYTIGEISAANGHASHACIVAAAEAALTGQVDALCTAPIAKEALFAAGYSVPGHTELLASLCGRDIVRMMLVGGGLRVVLQTIHVPLSLVPSLLTTDGIFTSLRVIADYSKMTGNSNPRIGVCGLNPHAGEAGHFGNEEISIITPAISQAQASGINAKGPYPADTIFHRTLQGDFDFVLAMYHDQGLIPVKTLDFNGGVNTTLGLPIIRTSPDHGTAFNIAQKGQAHEGSMTAAIKYAAQIARHRPA